MFIRSDLKNRAKVILKTSYWYALLVSFILSLFGSSSGWGSGFSNSTKDQLGNIDLRILGIIAGLVTIASLFALAIRIFIGYPLEVSGRKFFVENARGVTDLNYLGYSFRDNKYLSIVKVMFFKNLFVFLWTLLFIIPGIIKSYAYMMVPYLLADNPNLGYKEALRLSDEMTKGYKLDIFILDLSFIGWYLLGLITCGVGVLFVKPYHDATHAELYIELLGEPKDKVIIEDDQVLDDQTF
ncbi:MAG: DUF975 family protein [Clostridiales bacterium]|nr:DUF975 family protein [Clostridiales bacterium]